MAISLEKDGDGQPRFPGCSNIRDYEFVGKLGEGTFGSVIRATLEVKRLTDWRIVRSTKQGPRKTPQLWH